MRRAIACALLAACGNGGGGATAGDEPVVAKQKHGSGGFSASLTAEIEANGSGSGSGSSAEAPAPPAGAPVQAAAATPSPAPAASPDAPAPTAAPAPALGSGGPVTNHDISKSDVAGPALPRPGPSHVHVAPPPDLAAIKLDLEPNWDRDYDSAGTISFVLKVPNTDDTRLFAFSYGYDYPTAPADHDAYKKFLADRRVLDVSIDRQHGAAWYLEGADAAGSPAFRVVVKYGGKRLVCGGSLYKTREATALGADLRDKVVLAAKKICETIAL